LFDRHFDSIFGYIYRRTGEWDAARDLSSEVFLKALSHIWRYRWSGKPFSAWLFAIATNEIRMYFRRGKRAPASLDALMADAGISLADPKSLDEEREAADRAVERHEEWHRARDAISKLPDRYQEVLALRYFEQKSLSEIAAILGKPVGTIKSLLSRGLDRLRDKQCNRTRSEAFDL
jgi:RNA polymerase sigma-70 factor (ECF subfamily)